jgi:excisionase family DNA binding protein
VKEIIKTSKRPPARKRDKSELALTVEEAGQKIGLGRAAAYAAARRGELPIRRIGRKLVVPKAALSRWLEETKAKSAA